MASSAGKVYVYLGLGSGLSATAAWTGTGEGNSNTHFFLVATAGDVNADGYADIIVGSYGYSSYFGKAYVYIGSAAGLTATAGWTAESDQADANFGSSVSSAGDVNGDGYADVIVGAPNFDNGEANEGRAFLYPGTSSGLSTTSAWTAEGNQVDAFFGWPVATAGDVNGDGYSDVAIGAYGYDNGQTDEGRAFVYLGSASGLSSTPAWTAEGDQDNAWFGYSLATAGDVNGDGYSDIVIGSLYYDNGNTDEGRSFLYLGSASGLSSTPAWTAEVDQDSANFGYPVAPAGDVNGDGFSDVIVGAYLYDNGQTNEGGAFLYLGSSLGLSSAPAWTAEGNQFMAYLGNSVASAGDVNGDGYSDVIVGATYYDNGEADEGKAFLYLGSASGLGSAVWTAEGNQNGARFGVPSASAGDVNGDGYSDVVIGAPYFDNGETDEGRVFVYLGSASGLSSSPWTAEGNQNSANFGASIASAGDVNGDGYCDLVVGSYRYDNGQTDEGQAFLYYGNDGKGLSLNPEQRQADGSSLIAHLGKADAFDQFRIALTGRTPFGRGKFKLEWEVKPLGALFDGSGTGKTASWLDTGTTGLMREELMAGLSTDTVYHWRVRLLYHAAATPFQQASRWLTIPTNGRQEADLRTDKVRADLGVSQTDDPDPLLLGDGDIITYTVTVNNAGRDSADVTLADTLPGGSTFVSATPTQGTCNHVAGVVTCALGNMPATTNATVNIVVTLLSAGSYTNSAIVSSSAVDDTPGNNTDDETSTVNAPAIGNFVWRDDDADGVQDAGEPGLSGVVVDLYDDQYNWLRRVLTNPSGAYRFGSLTYGQSYIVKFFLPSSDYSFSPKDQGSNDLLDSDVDVTTGQGVIALTNGLDPTRWDCGMVSGATCFPPDEDLYLYSVTQTTDGNHYPILNFMDSNQPRQVTGYNVYRTWNPALQHNLWPRVASDVIDMDEVADNKQWIDTSGQNPPEGQVWYYQVAAYTHKCPAEGPW